MGPPGEGLTAVTGFVVAGGRSARMGRDKATLPWDQGDLLEHAITRLASVAADVRILCGPIERYADRGRPVLTDAITDAGALAGLLTALRSLPADGIAILLAVDLPLVPTALLQRLVGEIGATIDAVVPVTAAGPEPLCAAYRASCLAAVEAAASAGRFKMTSFWPDVRVREVAGAALAAFGDPAGVFQNVNTPKAYEHARRLAGA